KLRRGNMAAAEAMALERYTYRDVDKLCKRHLADRARIDGARIVRYERCEHQRFRPANAAVSALLLERIDFDRAFRMLDRHHQRVLIAWYGRSEWTQQQAADWVGCS